MLAKCDSRILAKGLDDSQTSQNDVCATRNRHLASSNQHLSNRFINRYLLGSLSFSTSVDAKGLSRFVPPMRNWKSFIPNNLLGSSFYYIRRDPHFMHPAEWVAES